MSEEQPLAIRIENLRQRVQAHNDRVNLLKGKIQSLEERLENCSRDLESSGLTIEALPTRIAEIQATLRAKIQDLETVLDSVDN